MKTSTRMITPEIKAKAYCCSCPDWNPLILSEAWLVMYEIPFMEPSTIWRSNHAMGREILLKMIFFVMKR